MNRVHLLSIFGAALLTVAPLSWADTSCSTPVLTIPDDDASGTSDSIVLAAGTLTDLDVLIIASHTWVGDLIFTLTHVDTGTSVVMIDRPGLPLINPNNGCGNDHIDVTLDDAAGTSVEDQCSATPPAIDGTHAPNNPLLAFNGEDRGGTWTLTASDNFEGDTGTLIEWCITAPAVPIDTDGDGVPDSVDNCTLVANPAQRDTNGDGFGNKCDADLNNDCVVNIIDLGILRSVFFSSDSDADFNGDGFVTTLDLGVLQSFFFGSPGPSGFQFTCGP